MPRWQHAQTYILRGADGGSSEWQAASIRPDVPRTTRGLMPNEPETQNSSGPGARPALGGHSASVVPSENRVLSSHTSQSQIRHSSRAIGAGLGQGWAQTGPVGRTVWQHDLNHPGLPCHSKTSNMSLWQQKNQSCPSSKRLEQAIKEEEERIFNVIVKGIVRCYSCRQQKVVSTERLASRHCLCSVISRSQGRAKEAAELKQEEAKSTKCVVHGVLVFASGLKCGK
ncbi:hypothetical protein CEXT_598981 [Caerostris extrusa]|uniref:Uncharacterized protein n=1 Tax=Caerostris extrusa TaxID=172846 RepID=A0AAV4VV43_CAEEX|nr:hypothetical protein CEXT_598981 [Caerostris extrusa]